MPAIFGDIGVDDELMHPLGTERNFNESMYFNFFDARRDYGGFLRIGNRANEGYAEVTACVYLPSGEVLFNYLRPQIADNAAFDAAGMRFSVAEPFAAHDTRYEGTAVRLAEPADMLDPRRAFTRNPHVPLAIELHHTAVGPAYGSRGSAEQEPADPERQFARGHYEQHMRVTGRLTIDGTAVPIEALGLRDHSWGARSWQALAYYRWLNCTFDPGFGIMVTEICPREGPTVRAGVVVRGDSLERIVGVDLASEFGAGTRHHRRLTARLDLESGGTMTLEGAVTRYIPLRNRRAGQLTHIGEGMTRYRCDGRTGVGISEYLDQVDQVDEVE
jgi:hypothetical protein